MMSFRQIVAEKPQLVSKDEIYAALREVPARDFNFWSTLHLKHGQKKITAIKDIREKYGFPLKLAKDFADAIYDGAGIVAAAPVASTRLLQLLSEIVNQTDAAILEAHSCGHDPAVTTLVEFKDRIHAMWTAQFRTADPAEAPE